MVATPITAYAACNALGDNADDILDALAAGRCGLEPVDEPEAEPEADGPGTVGVPETIDWDGDEELGVIDTSADIDVTLDQIAEQSNALVEEGLGVADQVDLGYELIGDIPPLELNADPIDSVPPPQEPLFEIVESVSSEVPSSSSREQTQAVVVEQSEDRTDGEQFEATTEKTERQFKQVFGMLWGLIRSIGPRQNESDQLGEARSNRRR